jgi:opacity protein-like surface antigen
VPTPWGDFEATIVSTPTDRMVRVPLSPNTEPAQQWFQPYVTAGSRKDVDSDPILEQARASAFADSGRTNLKAGAGVIFKLDDNVEVFGEYHFMRLQRDAAGRGALGPVGTSIDASGFSLGISVRY